MKNILFYATSRPTESGRQLLASCLTDLRSRSADAIFQIEHYATRIVVTGDLRLLNELVSSLEIIDSQLEYYFPGDDREAVDLGEWISVLALINTESEWLSEQIIEIDRRFGSELLTNCLRGLALSYAQLIPCVIAARFEISGDPVQPQSQMPRSTFIRQIPRPALAAGSNSPVTA